MPHAANKTQNELKKKVAEAVLAFVLPSLQSDTVLGVGTGSTVNYFIEALKAHRQRFRAAVASSSQTADLLKAQGIEVLSLNDVVELPFYIDGADEIDPLLRLIKGGGAALTQEKLVAACSKRFICIVDESKQVDRLGRFPLPVEVLPMARSYVARETVKLGARPIYRENVITDNHNQIIDLHDLYIDDPATLETKLNNIAGVVSNGLFVHRRADTAFIATEQGVKQLDVS